MQENNTVHGIRWTSTTKHVDIETGEQLRTKELNKYIKIKTTKYVHINSLKTKGTIEYTIQYRRNPQTSIW